MSIKIIAYTKQFIMTIMMCLCLSSSILAQSSSTTVGQTRLVIGEVNLQSAVSGSKVLELGDKIYQGDKVTTPATGYAVITLVDDTKFTIKPNSVFVFNSVSNTSNGKVLTELLKGGLKAITGQIGAQNPPGFKVDTPLGSIGIRGTNFDARLCLQGDCSVLHEALGCPSDPPREEEGLLYVTVSAGIAYLDDCKNDPDIKPGQVGVTDGKQGNCSILNEVPCFLNEFSWQQDQQKDQTLRSLEVPVLQNQDDPNFDCQGDPVCIQCQGDPLCIQCNGDPECYQCQGDPICIQCLGDPLCIQCQGDPLCIQCNADPECIRCQGDQICILCMGDPICEVCNGDQSCIDRLNNPSDPDPVRPDPMDPDPCLADPAAPGCPMDPCVLDPTSPGCPMDPCVIDPTSQGCPMDPCLLDPTSPGCPMDPCVVDPTSPGCPMDPCVVDPTSQGCPMDPCVLDPNSTECVCMMDPNNPICTPPPMCTTPLCTGECGAMPSIGCICSFEPNRPFCP